MTEPTIPINWHCEPFETLNAELLYRIMALRVQVFVVEQESAYLDIDGRDPDALHLYALDTSGELMAYARLFAPSPGTGYSAIGRVVVAPAARGLALGKALMQRAIAYNLKYWPDASIHIGAQRYLTRFYTELGFRRCGEDYDEDGIPHLPMLYKNK